MKKKHAINEMERLGKLVEENWKAKNPDLRQQCGIVIPIITLIITLIVTLILMIINHLTKPRYSLSPAACDDADLRESK